jgi:hypothetical protein
VVKKKVDVTCPFTGVTDLPVPMGVGWVLNVPGSNVWYFSDDEVSDYGLAYCIAHLLNYEPLDSKLEASIEILVARGDLKRVGKWWFFRRPIIPTFRIPSIVDTIIHQGREDAEGFCNDLAEEFNKYLAQLRRVLQE